MTDDTYATFDEVTLESLERLASIASLEAMAGSGFVSGPHRRLSMFFKNAGAFFNRLQFSALSALKLVPNDLNALVARHGFVDASNKEVIVPEGFIGLWLPYSASLRQTMEKATGLEAMIRTFNETLGRVIHTPELLESASGVGHAGPTALGIDEVMRTIGKTFFDPNSNHIHRTLGAVIERAADIPPVHANLNAAHDLDKAHPAKRALAAVNRTIALGDALMGHVDERSRTSKLAVQELIDITLQIAREMEAYGTLLYRIRQFSEAVKDSANALKN